MIRHRLPNRRPAVTETISFQRSDGSSTTFEASVGFDELMRPRELFLRGSKPGSEMDALLGDLAVVISVSLQSGVSAEAMAVSVGRSGDPPVAISVIGAALDLLAQYEQDGAQ